jgi:hypothetical protein
MSAVDYLFEQLWELPKDKLTWYAVLKEAKAKEKKQMKKAYNSDRPNLTAFTNGTAFKEYYDKNFNKE